MNYMVNKIITIIVASLLIIIFSGCITDENITGTYVYKTGAFFILNEDLTFYETFSDGNTASGTYTIASGGNLTMVYAPFGNFIVLEKIENGYKNKYGGIYQKK